jgi:hypothetical protein
MSDESCGQGYLNASQFFKITRRDNLQRNFLFQIEGGLGEVGGFAEVAPIIFIGAEGEDFFTVGGEAEVGGDDGEDAFFGDHREEAGGDDVDAGKGEGFKKWPLGFARGKRVGRRSRFLAGLGMTIWGSVANVYTSTTQVRVGDERVLTIDAAA